MSAAGRNLAIALALVVAGFAGVLAYRWLFAPSTGGFADPAPAVSMTDLQGRSHVLSELRGKVVLVNFWASWCAPCVDELPRLVKAQQAFAARGLQILGPAMDEPAAIKPLVARFAINYPVGADYAAADQLMRAFGNDQGVLPYSVLIDRNGQIVERILGGLHEEQLQELLEKQLGS